MRVRCYMPNPEHIMAVAREWIAKAENDLKNAANTLKMEEDCPTDTVCFHAQQCAEKYLKALLVWKGIPFPKTHDLPSLMAILPEDLHNLLTGEEQELLTEYATVTRYPGGYEDITLSEARSAVRVARRIRKDIRALLPREVLQSERKKMQRRRK